MRHRLSPMAYLSMNAMLVFVAVTSLLQNYPMVTAGGEDVMQGGWDLLLENAGVSAMHMALMYTNKVLMFDQTLAPNPTNITLPDARCKKITPSSPGFPHECWAHSVEYDLANNTVRPLHLSTDTWCSSGAFASNGTLVHTGGNMDGGWKVRSYVPCNNPTCDWIESRASDLKAYRWYASNQILPNGRVIVVGGINSHNYEFIPSRPGEGFYDLPFLKQTDDEFKIPYEFHNLYPFLHLSSDGNLFIFANKDSILFDYTRNQIVRSFPTLPGGPRNYPSSGSSLMFPLSFSDNYRRVEIIICGGAPFGTFGKADRQKVYDVEALNTCGRMEITSPNPQWAMEEMPGPRVMGDMLILPTGEILVINGARNGSAAYQNAREAEHIPWLYTADKPLGKRFTLLAPTTTPRVYHSTAIVLPDGRVLVAGSNSNYGYNFTDLVAFKTDVSVQAYSPYYLHPGYSDRRVNIATISTTEIKHGSTFTIAFNPSTGKPSSDMRYHAYAPPFNTHTVSMGQRMLLLEAVTPIVEGTNGLYSVDLRAPPSAVAAPPGYYLLTVVCGGIPSKAEWVRFLD